MGTKTQPGEWDCYREALPDEPMFILLGRDPLAPGLVRQWARERALGKGYSRQVTNAFSIADDMDEWRKHIKPAGASEGVKP